MEPANVDKTNMGVNRYMRNEYQIQIDRALVCRMNRRWKLYTIDQWSRFKLSEDHWDQMNKSTRPLMIKTTCDSHGLLEYFGNVNILHHMKIRFPCVQMIMDMYPGKIFAAGGFFTSPKFCNDIDLFFTDCDDEKLRLEIMNSFTKIFLAAHENASLQFSRSLGVTNFEVSDTGAGSGAYQFIHRVYPDAGHVLGGFDLSCSMVGYNGNDIVATEQGAWALMNKTIVVDISRRSLSFNHRLTKYHKRGFAVVFPGIDHQIVVNLLDQATEDKLKFAEELKLLKEKYKARLGKAVRAHSSNRYGDGYYNDYGYGMSLDGKGGLIYDFDDCPIIQGLTLKDLSSKYVDKPDEGYVRMTLNRPKSNFPHHRNSDYEATVSIFNGSRISNMAASFLGFDDKIIFSIVRLTENSLENIKIDTRANDNERTVFIKFIEEYFPDKAFWLDARDNDKPIDYKEIEETLESKLLSKLQNICWMTQDPGRQWSSTVNPEVLVANDFYRGQWNGLHAIIDPEVYDLLKCAMRTPNNIWSLINRDVFIMILKKIPYV
mgnify:FL=1